MAEACYVIEMTIPELDIAPRTRGRPAKPVAAQYVREVTEADLALLASGRGVTAPTVTKLRDRHHALARCLAQGMSNSEAGAVTGYCASRISILKADPAFQELVHHYTTVENSLMADFMERATNLSLTAVNELQERLEDSPEEMSTAVLLEVAKFAADRTGHAPIAKSVTINATVDMGSRLAAARQRVAQARMAAGDQGTPAAIEGSAIASGVIESGDSQSVSGVRGTASS